MEERRKFGKGSKTKFQTSLVPVFDSSQCGAFSTSKHCVTGPNDSMDSEEGKVVFSSFLREELQEREGKERERIRTKEERKRRGSESSTSLWVLSNAVMKNGIQTIFPLGFRVPLPLSFSSLHFTLPLNFLLSLYSLIRERERRKKKLRNCIQKERNGETERKQ